MSQHTISPEITHDQEHSEGTGRIWKIFWVLSLLTMFELALGYFLYFKGENIAHIAVLGTKIVIGVLTLLKKQHHRKNTLEAYVQHLYYKISLTNTP